MTRARLQCGFARTGQARGRPRRRADPGTALWPTSPSVSYRGRRNRRSRWFSIRGRRPSCSPPEYLSLSKRSGHIIGCICIGSSASRLEASSPRGATGHSGAVLPEPGVSRVNLPSHVTGVRSNAPGTCPDFFRQRPARPRALSGVLRLSIHQDMPYFNGSQLIDALIAPDDGTAGFSPHIQKFFFSGPTGAALS
jgi:hypothetical protein